MTPKSLLKYVVSMTITTSSGASSLFSILMPFSCRCTHFVLRPYCCAICVWVCLPCVNSFQISFVCSLFFWRHFLLHALHFQICLPLYVPYFWRDSVLQRGHIFHSAFGKFEHISAYTKGKVFILPPNFVH